MKRLFLLAPAALLLAAALSPGADPFRVLDDKEPLKDARLGKPKDYNGYFPWTPPTSKEAWEKRRQAVREQVLVANGLWPMPEHRAGNPVVHGKIDRDDYTIEKVFFASYPGHYVTGNLYRPKGKEGKRPGVLCPHGHWANGRFYENNDKAIDNELKIGAEKTKEGARYPLQARCATLARMGCVVFHYDMVGYADSKQIKHREGFLDAEAELRLQNFMGLQTFNSVCALDFLLGLPDVDPKRIGVTGASGGGTQTFILCAVDDRPTVAAPAVMVSTAMQGGCICENCSYLRVGTGNIELAGVFAPKPLLMIGADDWTIDIETKGYPELRSLYRLYGAEERVYAKCNKEFKHNYNQVSRELMYAWFNKYLDLGHKETSEKPFVPVPPKELAVFDEQHPLPKDAVDAAGLRKYLTESSDKLLAAARPKDAAGLKEFRRVVGTAARVLVTDALPKADEVEVKEVGDRQEKDGLVFRRYLLGRKGAGEQVPAVGVMRDKNFDGTVVVWVHPEGKSSLWKDGKLTPQAQQILDKKAAILAPDVCGTGEFGGGAPPVNKQFAGYTFGYNRPLPASRAHDILTAVAFAKGHKSTKQVHLLGWDRAGPWVVLARALGGDAVARTAADGNQFRFDQVKDVNDEMLLPGALKYGGLPAFAGLCAPHELYLHNQEPEGTDVWLKAAYQAAAKPDALQLSGTKAEPAKVVEWLLR